MTLTKWLQSLNFTARLVTINIGKQTWQGATGKTVNGTPYIYALGKLPACYKRDNSIYLNLDGKDWCIVCYCEKVEDQYKEYSPFGPTWLMHEWEREPKPPGKRVKVNISG